MKKTQQEMDKKIIFESPMGNLKGGWLELVKAQYLNCGATLLKENGNANESFESSVLFLISMIPKKEKREEIWKLRDELIEEEKKKKSKEGSTTPLSITDTNRIIHLVNIKIAGLVSDYVDQFIGLHEKLTYATVGGKFEKQIK